MPTEAPIVVWFRQDLRLADNPGLAFAAAGVKLGETYPWPAVEHGEARRRALEFYGGSRGGAAGYSGVI